MRAPPCRWIERDELGRPRCVHGWAHKAGATWRCPTKNAAASRKWDRTEAGRAAKRVINQDPAVKSMKALHELTRIRVS